MGEPFKGTINVDVRDSEPDWSPFEPPRAPDGAPSVVYMVLDDVGFAAMSCYGGPVETPNMDRIADAGVRYTQWHTTALCSPTRSCLLTGRNHTRNSMACITEAASGFPAASGTIPPENGTLAERPGLRAVVRVPRRGDEPVVSRPRLRQPSRRPAAFARGRLPPHRRPHRPGHRAHPGLQVDRAREALLPVLRARRLPRASPRGQGVDRQVQGPIRPGLRGDARTHPRAPEGARHRPEGHRPSSDQPDRDAREPHRTRRQALPAAGLHAPVGVAV